MSRTKVPFTRKKPCKGPASYGGGAPAHDQSAKGGGGGELRGRGGTERGLGQMSSPTC